MDSLIENMIPSPSAAPYPFCILWTPIPLLSWFFPMVGHTGVSTSEGRIRDFAGSYYVAEDNMAFGQPTKYWRLNVNRVKGGMNGWDAGVREASLEYCSRMHNFCCDNCHSHVAMVLNVVEYNGSKNWNAFKIAYYLFIKGKYVDKRGWLKTWLPFWTLVAALCGILYCGNYVK